MKACQTLKHESISDVRLFPSGDLTACVTLNLSDELLSSFVRTYFKAIPAVCQVCEGPF